MKLDTTDMSGKINKSAAVFSNDPRNPNFNLYITVEVKQYITISPQSTVNLFGFEGEQVKTEVTITSLLPAPLKISKVTSDIDDKIKYRLKTLQKGASYTLEVERRSIPELRFQGQITLTTDSVKKPRITLTVISHLKKAVRVRPDVVSFGTIDTSAESFAKATLKKTVTLQDARESALDIKRVVPSSDWIAAEQEKTDNGYVITITLDREKLPRGEFEESIEVRTGDRKQTISIPVKGKVI